MSKLLSNPTVGYVKPVDDNEIGNYPKTLVEGVYWDKEKKKLEDVLDESEKSADNVEYINGQIKVLEDILGITLDPNLDPKYSKYFTIEATEDDTTVYFRQSYDAAHDGLDPLKVEVSTDGGENWEEITAEPVEDDFPGATLAKLNAGDKVLVRGNNQAYGYYSEGSLDTLENCNFWADQGCKVSGNIMSLVSSDNFSRLRSVVDCAFAYFFSDYNGELDPWVVLDEEDPLLLPATTLAEYCYRCMFYGCTGLTSAPELPATTLAEYCYEYMFYGCTSLTVAPELPATTLAEYCYNNMFNGCTGLTAAPELPATTLAEDCYSAMFSGCTSLTAAPALPATTLAEYCYSAMFYGCTSLTAAPALPATTLAEYCYSAMFYGCSNLAYIKALFTTTPGSSYTRNWVQGVKATGTFVKSASATWNVTGYNGVPSGWTVETE